VCVCVCVPFVIVLLLLLVLLSLVTRFHVIVIEIYRLLEAPTALTLQDAAISETSLHFCHDTRPDIPEDSTNTLSRFLYKA
jgi:hypothetical protein